MRFVPAGIAADMENMCRQWRPGTGTGALGVFQDALPGIVDMVTWSAAAFHHVMKNSAEDLPRTLNPNFVKTTAEVYKLLFKAHQFATELPRQFEAMHQEFVYRRNLQGGHTANVGAGTPAG